ncbi:hypothetical protein SADUNF_Sadunf09G0031700 [Salix dunnii]|uniref:Uncharacterized protein n=1 Tax=Salix dunnii TaxID=1413687 RepID=A0A835JTU5_9ROSI|nr:hypothetical protein SADUNF_Sadunf09G0031700 [Salix dunnii]
MQRLRQNNLRMESIKTLRVGGLDARRAVSKGPLFCPRPNRIHKYGASPGNCICKAEKAGEQHANKLVIKGLRLKLRRGLDSRPLKLNS